MFIGKTYLAKSVDIPDLATGFFLGEFSNEAVNPAKKTMVLKHLRKLTWDSLPKVMKIIILFKFQLLSHNH